MPTALHPSISGVPMPLDGPASHARHDWKITPVARRLMTGALLIYCAVFAALILRSWEFASASGGHDATRPGAVALECKASGRGSGVGTLSWSARSWTPFGIFSLIP